MARALCRYILGDDATEALVDLGWPDSVRGAFIVIEAYEKAKGRSRD